MILKVLLHLPQLVSAHFVRSADAFAHSLEEAVQFKEHLLEYQEDVVLLGRRAALSARAALLPQLDHAYHLDRTLQSRHVVVEEDLVIAALAHFVFIW